MRFAHIYESNNGGKTKTLEITLEISELPVGIRSLIYLVWIIPSVVLLCSKTRRDHSACLNGIAEVIRQSAKKKGNGGRGGGGGGEAEMAVRGTEKGRPDSPHRLPQQGILDG